MNGTQYFKVKELYAGAGLWIIYSNITQLNLTDPFDTKEGAEKVLNSWRYADEMIKALTKINDLCKPSNQIELAIKTECETILNKVK